MKQYQQQSMIHRVHRNVRRMLSEARQVIKCKTRISNDIKTDYSYLQEISPLALFHLSTHLPPKNRDPVDKYRKSRAKERPYSLIMSNCEAESLGRSYNNSESKKKEEEMQIVLEKQQINITSFLNKDEEQLIDGYQQSRKRVRKSSGKQTILPRIIKNKQKRSNTEVPSSYLFTISVDALQKLLDQKFKERIGFQSQESNLFCSKQSKLRALKLDPIIIDKLKKKNKNSYIQSCDPWNNEYEQNDIFFQ